MLIVEAIGTITYSITLKEEDEKKVRKYAEKNDISHDEAIKQLWECSEIDIYAGEQTESDYSTESVGYSEFNEDPDRD